MANEVNATRIRPAIEADIPGMLAVLNDAIATSPYVFFNRPRSLVEQQAWFRSRQPHYPVIVAEDAEGTIAGWASLSPWAHHDGYDKTVEVSLFVHADHRGRGTGGRLLGALLAEGETRGYRVFIARIVVENTPSILLHERLNFERAGVMKRVGHKFNRWWDVAVYQKNVDPA